MNSDLPSPTLAESDAPEGSRHTVSIRILGDVLDREVVGDDDLLHQDGCVDGHRRDLRRRAEREQP